MKTTIAITTGSISLLLLASPLYTLRAAELPGPMGGATADASFSFDIKKKATYDFLSFKGATAPEAGGVRLKTKNGQGGAGWITKVDLSKAADFTPAITVTAGPDHKATKIMLAIGSQKASNSYTFNLSKLVAGTSTTILADDAASLADPSKPMPEDKKKDFSLASVSVFQFQGDWAPLPVDLLVQKISFEPPTADIKAQRTAAAGKKAAAIEKAAKEAAEKEKVLQQLLTKGADHPPEGPKVVQVCAVAADILAVAIQAGEIGIKKCVPYVAQPGDQIVDGKSKYKEFIDGKEVEVHPKEVTRMVDGKNTNIGKLYHNGKFLVSGGATTGKMLDERIASAPASYSIQSTNDAAYAQATAPSEVVRKAKPNGVSKPLPELHSISLKLPSPLKEGATYTIRFIGVNTAKESVTYTHASKKTQSLAIHAIQTGYRPDDSYKRAYFSYWMGTTESEGANSAPLPASPTFELIDASGKSVFTGKIESAKNAGAKEQISVQESVDYSKAAVAKLDFSNFNTPGEYRVHVPGIGTSGPFKIAADVWEKPFKAAMHGILTQRSGIALGPPFTEFRRPRPFHPDDGVQFYQMTIPMTKGQEGTRGKDLSALAAEGKLEKVTGIHPGGYQDAGDWDTLGHHLAATYDMLGMHDLNPEAFAKTKLLLPANEMNNNLPDILDEALWQLPLFKSLQLADGGVRGGYGYGWGCPEVSSDMIKSVGVYAADPLTSYSYAACAAKASRLLESYDKKLAAEYLASAKRAYVWGEKSNNNEAPDPTSLSKHQTRKRGAAALELFICTKEPAYEAMFKQCSELAGEKTSANFSDYLMNFLYARLPEGMGDPALKKKITDGFIRLSDQAIELSKKNAFDLISGGRNDIPIIFVGKFFSTPGQGHLGLIYTYELTKNPKYLSAAIQGSNHCLGANQDNLSYCSGVGSNAQRNAFRVDALRTGQASNQNAMMGHIPYGQGNEGNKMSSKMNLWVQQYILNFGKEKKMVPNWYSWPVYEQYVDFAIYPLHNENVFNDTTTIAACYWFYLNNRK